MKPEKYPLIPELIGAAILFLCVAATGCSSLGECDEPAPLPPTPTPVPMYIVPNQGPTTYGADRYGAPRARRFSASPCQQSYEYRLVPVAPAPRGTSECGACPDDGGVTPAPGPTPPDPFGRSQSLPVPPAPPSNGGS